MNHVRKYIFTILIILTAGTLLTGCRIDYRFSSGDGSVELKKEDAKEFHINKDKVDPITSIVIDARIANVELIASDDYYVEIDYLYWKDEPKYSLKNGKLSFSDRYAFPNSYSINFSLNNIIRIYLPERASLKRVNVDSSSGNATLSGFTAEDLNAELSYGDFKMENAAAVKANIDLAYGESEISGFQCKDLKFENSYGDASFTDINTGEPLLKDTEYKRIRIDMSSGNVNIDGMISNNIDIENSYGNVSCKDITADDFDADLNSGELSVRKADLKETDISNSYGDVILSLPGTMEDYSMDLDTAYGFVEVEGKDYGEDLEYDNGGSRSIQADLSSGNIKITFE